MNLLNEASDSRLETRIWNIVNDRRNSYHRVGNEIIYSTEALKSNICNSSDAYILVRGNITVVAAPVTQVAFKNCAPFIKCITKIG